jgi:hypothetical protein
VSVITDDGYLLRDREYIDQRPGQEFSVTNNCLTNLRRAYNVPMIKKFLDDRQLEPGNHTRTFPKPPGWKP